MWICTAHQGKHASSALPLPVRSPLPSHQPDTGQQCGTADTGWRISLQAGGAYRVGRTRRPQFLLFIFSTT